METQLLTDYNVHKLCTRTQLKASILWLIEFVWTELPTGISVR